MGAFKRRPRATVAYCCTLQSQGDGKCWCPGACQPPPSASPGGHQCLWQCWGGGARQGAVPTSTQLSWGTLGLPCSMGSPSPAAARAAGSPSAVPGIAPVQRAAYPGPGAAPAAQPCSRGCPAAASCPRGLQRRSSSRPPEAGAGRCKLAPPGQAPPAQRLPPGCCPHREEDTCSPIPAAPRARLPSDLAAASSHRPLWGLLYFAGPDY